MGGLCSKGSAVGKSPSDTTLGPGRVVDHHERVVVVEEKKTVVGGEAAAKRIQEEQQEQSQQPVSVSQTVVPGGGVDTAVVPWDGVPQLARLPSQKSGMGVAKASAAKVSEVSSILGRASTAGIGKAVEVLDTLGSSMTSLNMSGFGSGTTTKGNKISILAFEVANTIVKGCNLMHALSKDNIKHLKEVVLHSEGVQNLISKDMDELLKISAADKREELKVFSTEVVRFGNRCKDPQWHNLDRYFDKLASERAPQHHLKEKAESVMQQLVTCVQFTAELYHEMHALDRFEQDYQRKQQEEDGSSVVQRGDNLHILKQEVKSQHKHVKSLKKKSLWFKNLEEVIEKLVDIVHFLHLEIHNAFGHSDNEESQEPTKRRNRLGPAGLALHYANIISQIDTLVSRSSSIPTNTRDALYQSLPPTIKSSLRSKLHSFGVNEELTVSQIKAEMEKTLQWLVPIANNTTKAHHGFGWVGEWANTGSDVNCKPTGQMDLTRVETLYHADKDKTEAYILELVVWLHHLISQSKTANGERSPIKSPVRSPTQRGPAITLSPNKASSNSSPLLTQEDQDMLRDVKYKKFIPGISKSQEFDTKSRHNKQSRLSKSNSHSPSSGNRKELLSIRRLLPVIDFEIDRTKALDVIDRVDNIKVQ
ncbi:protein PSK SIMULATOR 1-like [Phragmites australis]|uniref:protein PSK SIMULATOR 1-like n=1 Tax=Phragmites australis TaxID=29695 RepID=UPI002D78E7D5|nr:protein PSK SIMULATOR 1-like [Phragmites australis]XP_062227332.1 protein PSK SIMULATOR 1-like [Phragmites australis]